MVDSISRTIPPNRMAVFYVFLADLSCAYKRYLAGANIHTFFSVLAYCGCFFCQQPDSLSDNKRQK